MRDPVKRVSFYRLQDQSLSNAEKKWFSVHTIDRAIFSEPECYPTVLYTTVYTLK
jgi:hypothetical protein